MHNLENTKYEIKYTTKFKKSFKKMLKRGKDENKFFDVLNVLSNGLELDDKYRNHLLTNCRQYMDCNECHIEPDWLLIYKIENDTLVLLLFDTGTHSDLF